MKRNFTALFFTQFFGVLNDNLLKSLLCFMAVIWNDGMNNETVVSLAASLLIIPYLILSPLAGSLASRFDKVKILRAAKFAELPIMLIASVAFFTQSMLLAYSSIFLMGAQSALYSPAKYGLVKELRYGEGIAYGTGMMEMLSFTGILLGTTVAGFIAEIDQGAQVVIFLSFMFLAFLGWFSSRKVPLVGKSTEILVRTSVNPIKFFYNTSKEIRKKKGLAGVILGVGFFWMIASMMQFNLFIFCSENMGLDSSDTGLVIAFLSIGIGLGCYIAGKILASRVEPGLSVIAILGMVLCFYLAGYTNTSNVGYISIFMCAAFCSGLYKVPLNAWFQQRISDNFRGKALAYLNMVVFVFVLLTAAAFYVLNKNFGAVAVFKFCFYSCLVCAIIMLVNIPVYTLRFIFLVIAKVLYKIRVKGNSHIPLKGGAIMISNHISFLDSFILVSAAPRNLRFVMYDKIYYHWSLHWFFKRLNMIPISMNNSKESLAEFTRRCQTEIQSGHILCIFPEGKLSRNGQLNEFKKGIEHLAHGVDVPVIPVRMDGVFGTPLVWNEKTGKLNGFWPWRLRKKVIVQVGEPIFDKLEAPEYREVVMEL